MITIRNLEDCHLIDNPELYREVTSYLLYRYQELLEYDDDLEDMDSNFSVLDEEVLPMLNDLGPPEEIVQISSKADGHTITIYRIIFSTEVIFLPAEISDQFSY